MEQLPVLSSHYCVVNQKYWVWSLDSGECMLCASQVILQHALIPLDDLEFPPSAGQSAGGNYYAIASCCW